jgi:hypothetical protein
VGLDDLRVAVTDLGGGPGGLRMEMGDLHTGAGGLSMEVAEPWRRLGVQGRFVRSKPRSVR